MHLLAFVLADCVLETAAGFFCHDRRIKLAAINHNLKEQDIRDLAAITHAYVGADLAALCQEAAMCALRRFVMHRQRNGDSAARSSGSAASEPQLPMPSPPDLMKVHARAYVKEQHVTFRLQMFYWPFPQGNFPGLFC